MTRAEKGDNVTIVACVLATGVYVPAMMICPIVRMKPELLTGGLRITLVTRTKVDGLPPNCSSDGSTIPLKRYSQVIAPESCCSF